MVNINVYGFQNGTFCALPQFRGRLSCTLKSLAYRMVYMQLLTTLDLQLKPIFEKLLKLTAIQDTLSQFN